MPPRARVPRRYGVDVPERPLLIDLDAQPTAALAGTKASRLGWLRAQGWPVPAGAVAPFDVAASLGGPPTPELRDRIAGLIRPDGRYVVRSSADGEDGGSRSFAGQFASVVDVTGVDDVLAAMERVAASVGSERVAQYARRVGVDPARIRMSVIVQDFVRPVFSGVAFSCDPITGADRVIVEAVEGAGERLVGRGETPLRWVRETQGVLSGPLDAELPRAVVEEVVEIVRAVAAASDEPADVEWVWDGERVWLVQWRPVTAAGQAARMWSSHLAKEMLPGLIPPLVWSVNVPVINAAWVSILDEALGATGLDPEELARPFGYRAYFDMGAFGSVFASLGLPRDALEQMRAGTRVSMRPSLRSVARRAPRLIRFAVRLVRWPRTAQAGLRAIEARRRAEAAVNVVQLSDADLLARVGRLRELFGVVGRLNVVTPLLADATAAAVRRTALRRGLDATGIDPGQELPAVRALDPAYSLAGLDPADDAAWARFLDRFGHLSDSPNDCSRPSWSEQPEAIHALLADPGHRARTADGASRVGGLSQLLARTPAWRRRATARAWSRAAALRLARERVGYTYARVYALFRPTFLEIGERLTQRGHLKDSSDVFLLTLAEVRAALAGSLPEVASLVADRRHEMAEAADVDLPEVILGDDPVPVVGRAGAQALSGTPTSPGRHVGPARVVTSLASAPHVGPDDVLVLEAADVTWTPLLLRAGAVVTESGGMLSHASIVAREVGIPCVASVDGATRIPGGTTVTVDGRTGEVLVLEPSTAGDEQGEREEPT